MKQTRKSQLKKGIVYLLYLGLILVPFHHSFSLDSTTGNYLIKTHSLDMPKLTIRKVGNTTNPNSYYPAFTELTPVDPRQTTGSDSKLLASSDDRVSLANAVNALLTFPDTRFNNTTASASRNPKDSTLSPSNEIRLPGLPRQLHKVSSDSKAEFTMGLRSPPIGIKVLQTFTYYEETGLLILSHEDECKEVNPASASSTTHLGNYTADSEYIRIIKKSTDKGKSIDVIYPKKKLTDSELKRRQEVCAKTGITKSEDELVSDNRQVGLCFHDRYFRLAQSTKLVDIGSTSFITPSLEGVSETGNLYHLSKQGVLVELNENTPLSEYIAFCKKDFLQKAKRTLDDLFLKYLEVTIREKLNILETRVQESDVYSTPSTKVSTSVAKEEFLLGKVGLPSANQGTDFVGNSLTEIKKLMLKFNLFIVPYVIEVGQFNSFDPTNSSYNGGNKKRKGPDCLLEDGSSPLQTLTQVRFNPYVPSSCHVWFNQLNIPEEKKSGLTPVCADLNDGQGPHCEIKSLEDGFCPVYYNKQTANYTTEMEYIPTIDGRSMEPNTAKLVLVSDTDNDMTHTCAPEYKCFIYKPIPSEWEISAQFKKLWNTYRVQRETNSDTSELRRGVCIPQNDSFPAASRRR